MPGSHLGDNYAGEWVAAAFADAGAKYERSPLAKSAILHEAANEARERVSKAYVQMDEIDRNAGLSRDGKCRQRSKSADEAIADFEASKTLTRAREAAKLAVAQNVSTDEVGMLKAMKELEQGWQKGMDKIAERTGRTKGPACTHKSFLPPRH